MRPPRHPPVEAGIVDQHDGVRALVAEVAIGAGKQRQEDVRVGEHAREPHDGELAERIEKLATGGFHAIAAEADAFDAGVEPAKLGDEVGAVHVAGGFAGADEDSHGRHPCLAKPQARRRNSRARCRVAKPQATGG